MPPPARRPQQEPGTELLDRIRSGDRAARDRLLGWVYDEGLAYFLSASNREYLLDPDDAADLAGECVLEFDRVLARVRNPAHYARRMFRNNLGRYLRRKRARRIRETDALLHSDRSVSSGNAPIGCVLDAHRLDDEQHRAWCAARRRIADADVEMQRIIRYRLAAEPLSYRVIGQILGASEPALRMRMTRFCRSVRREHARSEKRRAWRASDRMPAGRGRAASVRRT
ncbi:MAG: hypothetical protein HKN17_01925 [Rhodothermales bacterium]|nr:hypothetical protein [Rhodothermales bacterium]